MINAGDIEDAIETEAALRFDDILGWSMISHIIFLQLINFVVILISTIKDIKRSLHLRKLKKQQEEYLSIKLNQPAPTNFITESMEDQAEKSPLGKQQLKVRSNKQYFDQEVSAQLELISEVEEKINRNSNAALLEEIKESEAQEGFSDSPKANKISKEDKQDRL